MKISFYTVTSNLGKDNGYGYAGYHIRESLKKIGHELTFDDKTAGFQIDFCQPNLYKFYEGQYRIGYTPWESTVLPDGWMEGFNSVDELWTTSNQCKEWYQNAGFSGEIRVFLHGIDQIWTKKARKPQKKLKFLHIGEPAPRKGGQMAMEAFVKAFGANTDVELTIKAQGHSTVRAYASDVYRGGPRSILGLPHEVYRNVTLLTDNLSLDDLVRLYHEHDVFVYPSWGEGFGLMPLQALATGMPTICTGKWAPYEQKLRDLSLNSTVQQSPWPIIHPGDMLKPDIHHLIELYRHCYNNWTNLSEQFYNQADSVHEEYNWDRLTAEAFEHLGDK